VKPPTNVLETARELGAREFVRRVQQNGLYDLLTGDGGGPYTIFVPTDEAFAVKIPERDNFSTRRLYNVFCVCSA